MVDSNLVINLVTRDHWGHAAWPVKTCCLKFRPLYYRCTVLHRKWWKTHRILIGFPSPSYCVLCTCIGPFYMCLPKPRPDHQKWDNPKELVKAKCWKTIRRVNVFASLSSTLPKSANGGGGGGRGYGISVREFRFCLVYRCSRRRAVCNNVFGLNNAL